MGSKGYLLSGFPWRPATGIPMHQKKPRFLGFDIFLKSGFGKPEMFGGTRVSMEVSKWIITPIKVGCKSRK